MEMNVATAVFQVSGPKIPTRNNFFGKQIRRIFVPNKAGKDRKRTTKTSLVSSQGVFSFRCNRVEHSATIGRKDVCFCFCIAKPEFCGSLAVYFSKSLTFFCEGQGLFE